MNYIFNWNLESHVFFSKLTVKNIFLFPFIFDATLKLSNAKILKYMKLRSYKLYSNTWPHWVLLVLLWLPGKPFLLCESVSCPLSHSYVFIKSQRLDSSLLCSNSLFPGIKKGKPTVVHWKTEACLEKKKPEIFLQDSCKEWCAKQQKRLLLSHFKNKIKYFRNPLTFFDLSSQIWPALEHWKDSPSLQHIHENTYILNLSCSPMKNSMLKNKSPSEDDEKNITSEMSKGKEV